MGGSKDRGAFNTLSNGESFNLQGGLGKTLARCPLSIRLAPFSMKYPFSVCLGVRDGVG